MRKGDADGTRGDTLSRRQFGRLLAGATGGMVAARDAMLIGTDLLRGRYMNADPSPAMNRDAFAHAVEGGPLPYNLFHLAGADTFDHDPAQHEGTVDGALGELDDITLDPSWYDIEPDGYDDLVDDRLPAVTGHDQDGIRRFMDRFADRYADEIDPDGINILVGDFPSGRDTYRGGAKGLALDDRMYETGYALIDDAPDIGYEAVHESAHILGLTHTAADGMTNTFLGGLAAAQDEDFFGYESRQKWDAMVDAYRAGEL